MIRSVVAKVVVRFSDATRVTQYVEWGNVLSSYWWRRGLRLFGR